jgi:hypothetical protein
VLSTRMCVSSCFFAAIASCYGVVCKAMGLLSGGCFDSLKMTSFVASAHLKTSDTHLK